MAVGSLSVGEHPATSAMSPQDFDVGIDEEQKISVCRPRSAIARPCGPPSLFKLGHRLTDSGCKRARRSLVWSVDHGNDFPGHGDLCWRDFGHIDQRGAAPPTGTIRAIRLDPRSGGR